MTFPKINPKQSFPKLEEEILVFWEKEKIFEKSLAKKSPAGEFKFFDGPPFATGLPHYGHILQGVIKDLIPRYKTMRGFKVPRVWGWDCHGLPVENLIEKELGLKSKKEIEKFGVGKFNEKCRESVLKYAEEWQKTVRRMGRWIEMENAYKTMDLEFMDSVWWVFGELWKKGLIYEGLKPMHICPRCETPLSNFEVGLGYREITDLSATVKFELADEPGTFLLAWTTTPWTLPGNVALAVGKDIEYVKFKRDGRYFIASKDRYLNLIGAEDKKFRIEGKRVSKNIKEKDFSGKVKMLGFVPEEEARNFEESWRNTETLKGKDLVGKTYKPLFPYFAKNDNHEVIPGIYFITFNTENSAPIFKNEKLREICAEAFREVVKEKNYKIYELAVMPDHIHLVVEIEESGESLPKTLQQIKGVSSHKIQLQLTPQLAGGLTSKIDEGDGRPFIKLWRKGYDKKFIYSENEYENISDYIRQNPMKKKLPLQKYDWLETFDDINQPIQTPSQTAFRIVAADFVSTDEGTGIVHIAPAFGEDDYEIAKKENLPVIQHVSMDGSLISEIAKDFENKKVKFKKLPNETDKLDEEIVKKLDEKNLLFTSERKRHSYPHCWRCETPLLNFATSSWFVAVEKIKKDLLENNQKINWIPAHIKNGRFGKWLESARDWAVSRNRFWGAPLPIWRCEKCGKTKCISSKDELEKLSGEKIKDLHKHFVDEIEFDCECGAKMRRIPEVLDCWFESGSMPFAQFGEKEKAEIPANFIAEAQDQTRGWFYTLHVLATALKNKPAFSNCVCSGLVLAEDGEKMSKSKQNFPPPAEIFEKYGADAMRLYLMSSPVTHAENLRFSEKGVEEILRGILLPLWNTFYFFTTYANADGWKNGELPAKLSNPLDRWIISELNLLIRKMTDALENYEIQKAVAPLSKFLDGLTNWYVRRSRRRFWKSENDADKNEAYATLFEVLKTVSKLLAPVCPFISEKIYKDLTSGESVHLKNWSKADKSRIDENLSEEIELHRKIISLGLKVRANEKIKVRQPLSRATIVTSEKMKVGMWLDVDMICEELNVKNIKLDDDEEHESMVKVIVTINTRVLGPRLGKKVQDCVKEAKAGNFEIKDGNVYIAGELLTNDEAAIKLEGKKGFATASDDGIVVILDTKITPELKLEGAARDLVRAIQDLRKKAGYDVSDRIELQLEGADGILEKFEKYIAAETLAKKVSRKIDLPDAEDSLAKIKFGVKKIGR